MKQWLLSVKSNKVKYILVFCVVVQLLCTGLCLVNFAQVRKAGDRELSDYSDRLVEAISSDFQRNNTFLQTIMLTSSWGLATTIIPSTGSVWNTVRGTSPVPGGMSTNM